MQAAKIIVGKIYAYTYRGELCRFRADAVITRRDGSSGTPYSQIEGVILEEGGRGDDGKLTRITIKPNLLDGLYTEHVELRRRQEHEDALKKEREVAAHAEQESWRDFFYSLTNAEKPELSGSHSQPFRLAEYSSAKLDIQTDGVALLIKWFRDNGFYKP